MAGDWIKMRTDLYRDPKVCLMADILSDEKGDLSRYVSQQTQRNMTVTRNVTRNACVGALLSVWGVMRHRGVRVDDDLRCFGVGLWVIDDIADLPGFGVAMAAAMWVVETEECLIFPRFFDEYNVEPDGKQKSKNAERQARYREKKRMKPGPESNVTSNVTRNVTVTPREEESREEKSNYNTHTLPAKQVCDKYRNQGIQITEAADGVTIEVAEPFCKWMQFRFTSDGKHVNTMQQDVILKKFLDLDSSKLARDVDFSIGIGAKHIRSEDADNGPGRPRRSGGDGSGDKPLKTYGEKMKDKLGF